MFSPVYCNTYDVLRWLPVYQPDPADNRCFAFALRLDCATSDVCDLCRPVCDVAARRLLSSATAGEILIPRAHLAIMQRVHRDIWLHLI